MKRWLVIAAASLFALLFLAMEVVVDPITRLQIRLYVRGEPVFGSAVELPASAKPEEILKAYFDLASNQSLKPYKILEVRQIKVNSYPLDAALVDTRDGQRIITFAYNARDWVIAIYDDY